MRRERDKRSKNSGRQWITNWIFAIFCQLTTNWALHQCDKLLQKLFIRNCSGRAKAHRKKIASKIGTSVEHQCRVLLFLLCMGAWDMWIVWFPRALRCCDATTINTHQPASTSIESNETREEETHRNGSRERERDTVKNVKQQKKKQLAAESNAGDYSR